MLGLQRRGGGRIFHEDRGNTNGLARLEWVGCRWVVGRRVSRPIVVTPYKSRCGPGGQCGGQRSPNAREDLHQVPEISLYSALTNGSDTCRQDYQVEPFHEYLEVGDRVRDAGKAGDKCDPPAEVQPLSPEGVAGAGAVHADSTLLGPPGSAVAIMRHGGCRVVESPGEPLWADEVEVGE